MSPTRLLEHEENDDSIRFKLPANVKAEFFTTCYQRGQTPSVVLRNLVDAYNAGLPSLPANLRPVPPDKTHKGKA